MKNLKFAVAVAVIALSASLVAEKPRAEDAPEIKNMDITYERIQSLTSNGGGNYTLFEMTGTISGGYMNSDGRTIPGLPAGEGIYLKFNDRDCADQVRVAMVTENYKVQIKAKVTRLGTGWITTSDPITCVLSKQ